MSLIDKILKQSGERLEARRSKTPLRELEARAKDAQRGKVSFREALKSRPFSLIAEIKMQSPSVGKMNTSNVDQALPVYDTSEYVSAISVLTDWDFFGSSLERLIKTRGATSKPLLRKDFIVDEYQVWEARAHGADAILLMAGVLSRKPETLRRLYDLATSLEMDVLFEIGMSKDGPERQAEVIPSEAPIWGINSRRFNTSRLRLRARLGSWAGRDLSIDRGIHETLRTIIPPGKIAVAESGINKADRFRALVESKYHAALIGTAFLKGPQPVQEVVSDFTRGIVAALDTSPNRSFRPARAEAF